MTRRKNRKMLPKLLAALALFLLCEVGSVNTVLVGALSQQGVGDTYNPKIPESRYGLQNLFKIRTALWFLLAVFLMFIGLRQLDGEPQSRAWMVFILILVVSQIIVAHALDIIDVVFDLTLIRLWLSLFGLPILSFSSVNLFFWHRGNLSYKVFKVPEHTRYSSRWTRSDDDSRTTHS